jgi:hypothetical protein
MKGVNIMENDPDDIDRKACEAGGASADDSADQPVGYGRPPVNTRFRKGQSGHRNGRPKGSRGIRALYQRLMRETVRVRDGDKTRRISTSDALTQVLLRAAMKGERGAVNVQMYLEDKAGLLNQPDEDDTGKTRYLVAAIKPPLEEWSKFALRAAERNRDPEPKPQGRLPKVTRDVDTGEITIHPLD